MPPSLFIRVKGFAMIPLGALIVLLPVWFIGLFGQAELGGAAEVFIRLFGLIIVAVGISMGTTPAGYNVRPVEALTFAAGDLVALGLLLQAVVGGAMGVFGYVFAVVYVVSACGFFYCWKAGSN